MQKQDSKPLRKRGFELAPGRVLVASQAPEGQWIVWVELNGVPVESEGQLRVFEGATRFQAQCKAVRWLSRCPV